MDVRDHGDVPAMSVSDVRRGTESHGMVSIGPQYHAEDEAASGPGQVAGEPGSAGK
jgi:hypothetical protein